MKRIKEYDAVFIGNKVVVSRPALSSTLFNRGSFGAFVNGKLELSLEEAVYLHQKKELKIYNEKGKLFKLSELVELAKKKQKRFWVRYLVFSDLRNMGYLPKTAFKYGGDFRVYNKGAVPGKEHAEWILYCSDEHDSVSLLNFSAMNRVAHSVRKRLLMGVVDDEGSVTYYEVNWVRM
ncbi:MAG: tRNA-intron lyase [Candidatus Parvarchaeota archaeon]|jgi:tRNA-intron endonuclease|nr:tRNA-intron lyase [Candidatus Parvarchaeota archaeon]MCL5420265.1 tRNA-intron lyase [Candidatus Parvarchaeota archaeon]